MKKIIFSIAFFTLSFLSINAQEISDSTLGIRLGDNGGVGGEISYQFKKNDSNRIELNLGLRDSDGVSAYKLTGTYQWVWDLDELSENFNWYAGFGGGVGTWKVKALDESSTVVVATGVVGIEYSFEFPLLLSLDIRPEFGFNDAYDGLNSDIALGIRYQF
jgi:hypothetical protein